MARFIMSFGPMLWPQLVVSLCVAIFAIVAAIGLFRGDSSSRSKARVDAVLYSGSLGALFGLLGLCFSLFNLFGGIARHAGELGVSPRTVAIGLGECLLTPTFGFIILVIASLLWAPMRGWWRRLDMKASA